MKKKAAFCKLPGLVISFMLVFGMLATLADAKTKGEINAGVDASMMRFKEQVKGADEYLRVAKGMLIIPNITKVGFILGGQYGQGALRADNRTIDYYSLAAGSVGWQIGAQQFDMVIIFVTEQALKKFRSNEGWEAGADAEVTMIDTGVNVPVGTLVSRHPIMAFILDQKGLMAGVSVKGAKFTRIYPD